MNHNTFIRLRVESVAEARISLLQQEKISEQLFISSAAFLDNINPENEDLLRIKKVCMKMLARLHEFINQNYYSVMIRKFCHSRSVQQLLFLIFDQSCFHLYSVYISKLKDLLKETINDREKSRRLGTVDLLELKKELMHKLHRIDKAMTEEAVYIRSVNSIPRLPYLSIAENDQMIIFANYIGYGTTQDKLLMYLNNTSLDLLNEHEESYVKLKNKEQLATVGHHSFVRRGRKMCI